MGGFILSGEKCGPGNGVEKGREKIADPDLGHVHQVDSDPQDDEAACCGHCIQDCRFTEEVEA